jgi:hypothetical protein
VSTISQMIAKAEEQLGRGLDDDEVFMIGKMVQAERSDEEILELLTKPAPAPPEEGKTYRYEVAGSEVRPIPEGQPEVEMEAEADA